MSEGDAPEADDLEADNVVSLFGDPGQRLYALDDLRDELLDALDHIRARVRAGRVDRLVLVAGGAEGLPDDLTFVSTLNYDQPARCIGLVSQTMFNFQLRVAAETPEEIDED